MEDAVPVSPGSAPRVGLVLRNEAGGVGELDSFVVRGMTARRVLSVGDNWLLFTMCTCSVSSVVSSVPIDRTSPETRCPFGRIRHFLRRGAPASSVADWNMENVVEQVRGALEAAR